MLATELLSPRKVFTRSAAVANYVLVHMITNEKHVAYQIWLLNGGGSELTPYYRCKHLPEANELNGLETIGKWYR
jgi:hypothetical protein